MRDALRGTIATISSAAPVAPPDELWSQINTTIGRSRSHSNRAISGRTHFISIGISRLAAAALLLIAVSVSATVWFIQRDDSATSSVASMDATSGASTTLQLTSTDAQFVASVESLERQLAANRGKLRPQTVAILERSLRTIDDALLEARTALLADPANAALRIALESTYRQKLDFLTRATQIASSE
jgi:hypothetical protein